MQPKQKRAIQLGELLVKMTGFGISGGYNWHHRDPMLHLCANPKCDKYFWANLRAKDFNYNQYCSTECRDSYAQHRQHLRRRHPEQYELLQMHSRINKRIREREFMRNSAPEPTLPPMPDTVLSRQIYGLYNIVGWLK